MPPQTQPPPFRAEVEIARRAALLSLFGELRARAAAASFDHSLRSVEVRVGHVVVDLRGLTAMHSMGLGVLVEAAGRAEREIWRLSVVRGPEAVDALFRLKAIEAQISLYNDAEGLFPPPTSASW
jgi:anti-anti-sigma factor